MRLVTPYQHDVGAFLHPAAPRHDRGAKQDDDNGANSPWMTLRINRSFRSLTTGNSPALTGFRQERNSIVGMIDRSATATKTDNFVMKA